MWHGEDRYLTFLPIVVFTLEWRWVAKKFNMVNQCFLITYFFWKKYQCSSTRDCCEPFVCNVWAKRCTRPTFPTIDEDDCLPGGAIVSNQFENKSVIKIFKRIDNEFCIRNKTVLFDWRMLWRIYVQSLG